MSINQVSEWIKNVISNISNWANWVEQLLLETYERVNEVLGQKDEKEIKDILIDYKEDWVELVEWFRPKKIDTKWKIEKEAENWSDRISYFIEQWFPNSNYQSLSLKEKILLIITYWKAFKDDEGFEEKSKNPNHQTEREIMEIKITENKLKTLLEEIKKAEKQLDMKKESKKERERIEKERNRTKMENFRTTLNFIFQNRLGIRNIGWSQYDYQYQIWDINKARELRRWINKKDEFYVEWELRRFDSFLQSYKNWEEEIACPIIIRIIELLEDRKKEQWWRWKIKKNWKWYFW